MILPIVATAICAFAVVKLVLAEADGSLYGRFLWKPFASAAFIAVALVGGGIGADSPDSTVARWIVAGLCLGAIGDVALMFEHQRGFIGGLVAFLLGHVAYVVAFTQIVPLDRWAGGPMPVLIVGAVIAAVVILRWLWPHLGELRVPVIAYVVVISTMMVGGLAASLRGGASALDGTARGFLTAGAAAFYLSDLAVAREKFTDRDLRNRTIGLPVYYGAQLLFAWSIVP